MEHIEKAFYEGIISEEDMLLLKEYNQRLKDNNVPVIYNLRHLRQLLGIHKSAQDRLLGLKKQDSYKTFFIPKKHGGLREIEAPNSEMKMIQYWIKDNILDKFSASQYARGFIKGKSIYDNAVQHTNKELVINIDLKDFFPSIGFQEIYKIFKYIGYTDSVSKLLTNLCTNTKGVLPQGSPASPAISNLVALKLDKRLGKLSEKIAADYTRYADDITISGDKSIKRYISLIRQIIFEEGYEINENKFRLQHSYQRQEVTGLIVNNGVIVPKKYINELENAIYYCKKYGVTSHMQKINCEKGFYKEHLYGIAYFIKMVDKSKGEKFILELNEIEWPI